MPPKSGATCRLPARSARCCSAALRRATSCRHCSRATRGRKPKPSYSEERNTKTATVTATPTPTPKPAPIATPMPMLATVAPTAAPSTTPTNTLNGKAATPQREIFVPWLRFFPLTVIVPDTGLKRQYQSIRLFPSSPGGTQLEGARCHWAMCFADTQSPASPTAVHACKRLRDRCSPDKRNELAPLQSESHPLHRARKSVPLYRIADDKSGLIAMRDWAPPYDRSGSKAAV